MSKPSNLLGIFGGAFDPIHYGHLRLALELLQQLSLREVRFIPCRQPVHRSPLSANPKQRLEMLNRALQNQPGFIIDTREILRTTPSYMYETLLSLRQEFHSERFCLILGSDALSKFTTWHEWQQILKLTHIIGVTRPGWSSQDLPSPLQSLLTTDAKSLQKHQAGLILLQETTPLQISATAIREQIKRGLSPKYLIPDAVLEYIVNEKIYS